ncbi:MAG: hypothetical protein JKY14_13595 [Paraglaciecola sp.]|nr:hypothetical protein [Paraglaciecola sp.]
MISLALLTFALFVNLTIRDRGDAARVTAICLIPLGMFQVVIFYYGRENIGEVYFWLAALVSMFVVVTAQMFERSPLSTSIQVINLVAAMIHLYGLHCFNYDLGYALYSPLIYIALIAEWLRLMIRTKKDGVFWSNHWLRNNADNHSLLSERGDT